MKKNKIWQWVFPIVLFQIGTQLSFWSNVTTGSSLFYFPVPIALILTYWWGPKVLPALFLNATLSAGIWGLQYPLLYPLYAFPETLYVFLSWVFFIKMAKGKAWLPSVKELTYFLITGIVVPLIIYKILLEGIFVWLNQIPKEDFFPLLITTSLGDFISIFGVTIPILYFASARMQRHKLTVIKEKIPDVKQFKNFWNKRNKIEIGVLTILILILSLTVNFEKYWFLYGILSLYSAIRFGFGISILVNSFILLLTYMIPSVLNEEFNREMILGQEMTRIQMGTGLLYVFSLITGRVISDAKAYETQIEKQNRELEHVNKELDRFVYSVSHDLSAPLKSIRGLVNISRVENMNAILKEYINHIEISVNKLESFISEILDFSRNDRQPLSKDKIHLKELCHEILASLQYFENFESIRINMDGIEEETFFSDKMRIKIIITNLLSNAIKYQKPGKEGLITIRSKIKEDKVTIEVEDNGEGIPADIQNKVFNMFFRGTPSSQGSGLGLYIAREVTEKLNGTIKVKSEVDNGSRFIVRFPVQLMNVLKESV